MENNKYKEIFKLKDMLEEANIPFEFEFIESEPMGLLLYEIGVRYHLCYPCFNKMICSVIEGYGTYGGENDKLEIMGLLTPKELEVDTVVGHLTAENVFDRIKTHWDNCKENKL